MHLKWSNSTDFYWLQLMASAIWFTMAGTTVTICSNFVSRHIRFVTNMRHGQTLCITLDLIWRKQQVKGKIAFYFSTETCCLLQTKSNVCNLKKVFESRKTCSNAAQQLVDGLSLWCRGSTVPFSTVPYCTVIYCTWLYCTWLSIYNIHFSSSTPQ